MVCSTEGCGRPAEWRHTIGRFIFPWCQRCAEVSMDEGVPAEEIHRLPEREAS